MIKVVYKVPGTFSLKKFKDSHLSARSYYYPMLTTIRGAILGSIIERKGKKYAESIFEDIKNLKIFVKCPPKSKYSINQEKIKRMTNKGYSITGDSNLKNREWDNYFTVGVREFVCIDEITFYIEGNIKDIEEHLVNIRRLGDSESIVILESIEKDVDKLENILMPWNEEIGYEVDLHELYDWNDNVSFENRYIYSNKAKDDNKKIICYVEKEVCI